LDVSPDGALAWAAAWDGVYRVALADGQHQQIGSHGSYVSGVAWVAEGRQLISAGYDGVLKWHDLEQSRVVREVQAHSFWSWDLAVSPDRQWVASVSGQYRAGGYRYEPAPAPEPCVKLFSAESGALAWERPHVPSVQSVALSPDNALVAAANLMGEVRVWELAGGREVAHWRTEAFTSWGVIKSHCYIGGIFALQFTPDGQHLLLAGMGPMRDPMAGNGRQLWQRYAWSESPPRLVDQTHSGESGEGLMETLALHPAGGLFAMAGRLRGGQWNTGLFSLDDGRLLHSLRTDFRVTQARFSPDGQRLLLAGLANQTGDQKPFGRLHVYQVDIA
jgi:WD40 repeat protein